MSIAKRFGNIMMAAFLAISVSMFATAIINDDAYAYEQRENIVSYGHGWMDPDYLVVHETANPGASAWNHVLYWGNNQPWIEMAHYVMELDGSVVYHTQSDDTIAWHVGNGNAYTVGIELAHAVSQTQFDNQWNEAVKWCGDYLMSKGWGIDRLLSHAECAYIWGGTDHTDPNGYFASFGRSWNQFEQAVADYIGGGYVPDGGSTTTAPSGGEPGYSDSGFGGTYTCMVDQLNIRKGPGLGYGTYGAFYYAGETVELDDYYSIADGYVWGRYTSWSGNECWVAVGRATGQVESDDYLVKGGSVSSGSTGSSYGGGWYEVTADVLNIRDGIWGNIVGSLPYGYDLYVSGFSNGWAYYTAWSGNVRWVSADYLA